MVRTKLLLRLNSTFKSRGYSVSDVVQTPSADSNPLSVWKEDMKSLRPFPLTPGVRTPGTAVSPSPGFAFRCFSSTDPMVPFDELAKQVFNFVKSEDVQVDAVLSVMRNQDSRAGLFGIGLSIFRSLLSVTQDPELHSCLLGFISGEAHYLDWIKGCETLRRIRVEYDFRALFNFIEKLLPSVREKPGGELPLLYLMRCIRALSCFCMHFTSLDDELLASEAGVLHTIADQCEFASMNADASATSAPSNALCWRLLRAACYSTIEYIARTVISWCISSETTGKSKSLPIIVSFFCHSHVSACFFFQRH